MISDNIKITGNVKIDVFSQDGLLKESQEIKNLVVNTGKYFIASRMVGASAATMGWMELGTGTTAAAVGDTALQSAIGSSRVALATSTSSTNVVTYTATFPAGTGTGAVTEAGIFNAASAGTMLCRTVFSVVNKGASDVINITWTVTVN
tara:strand:+ start:105 stop:551 length:447 start_codon:yes stop_codon:yes gene_type:complete